MCSSDLNGTLRLRSRGYAMEQIAEDGVNTTVGTGTGGDVVGGMPTNNPRRSYRQQANQQATYPSLRTPCAARLAVSFSAFFSASGLIAAKLQKPCGGGVFRGLGFAPGKRAGRAGEGRCVWLALFALARGIGRVLKRGEAGRGV